MPWRLAVSLLSQLLMCLLTVLDFTPSNILLQTSGFDGLTEEQLIQVLGEPVRLGVETSSGEPASVPIAPKYVVRPIKFEKIDPRFISDQICVIDYGESFEVSNPPKYIGTPQIYRSPELVLDDTVGIGCDLWALGCTLFATRTGRPLFNLFDNDVDENLSRMVLLFGKLPKPWWTGWEGRRANFEDEEEDSLGRVRLISRTPEDADARAMELDRHNQPRSIREALAQIPSYQKYETQYPIPQRDEIELLADLLGKLLKYNPQERITAEMAKDHMWFKM